MLDAQRCRQRRLADPRADLRASLRQLTHVLDVEVGEHFVDAVRQTLLRQEFAIRVRGRGESAGNGYAELRERSQHLSQRGVLASNPRYILAADFVESDYMFHHECPEPSYGSF